MCFSDMKGLVIDMSKDIKFSLISLGCSKNLVDSECMVTAMKQEGFSSTENIDESNVVIINTCGFIEDAKKEAIETILSVAEHKVPNGNVEHIVVTGCLPQRYASDILESMPEVDIVLGTSHYQDVCAAVKSLYMNEDSYQKQYVSKAGGLAHIISNRDISTKGYAWLKIGEGCRNCCTFCAIPLIRGNFVSRPMEDIVEEAKITAGKGFKEIILAAQDTTNYGIDLYGKRSLPLLLKSLSEIDGIELIRIMYGYMDGIDDELINEIKVNPKIAHYMDIPIQHGNDRVLKAMNRKDTVEKITEVIDKLRKEIPDIIIRTTVMVGFPGETEDEFNDLINNLKRWKFDRLGCFMFSPEEGTMAFNMDNQIDENVKKERFEKVYEVQRVISEASNKNRLGTIVKVFVESIAEDGIFYKGRSYGEAPEVDPTINVIASVAPIDINQVVNVRIVDYSEYELTGETI